VLVQRLLAPLVVLYAAARSARVAVVLACAVGGFAIAQRVAQGVLSTRVEARLYERTVDATLRADVLQRSVLPDDEARAVLFEGMHVVVSMIVTGLPSLAANVVAACALAVVVAATQSVGVLAASLTGCGFGAAWLLGSRRAMAEAWTRLSPLWGRVVDGVTDAFDGRVDIVAAGRTEAYEAAYADTVRLWKVARLESQIAATFAGRLPLLMTAAAVGGGVVLQGMARGEPFGSMLVDAAVLGSMAPAFVGVAQGLQELLRNAPRLRAMDALLAVAPKEPTDAAIPQEPLSRIELRDVQFAYRLRGGQECRALTEVSFGFGRRELVAVAGPNGSGKSTCLHAILGTARPSDGDVWIDGVPLAHIDIERWRRLVGYLPQRPYLPPRVTLRACLGFLEPNVPEVRMKEALTRVGLAHVDLGANVDALSVGQRQRVGIARLLCIDRPVVLLDEPDAGLDPAGLALITQTCRELARERIVLVAAHSQELLAASDRVILLDEGRVISDRRRAEPGQK
jgi:ABC-type transport system involved in cytochrome bd biosynthesis fused ATPase/permease subunit